MADTPVSPTPITAWPTAPQRTDAPATFVTRADAWVAATASRTTQMNALATNVNFNATSAFDSAAEAVVSASAASTSASNAAAQVVLAEAAADAADATANATIWTTGEAITEGDNRYSPTDFLTYRANKNISSGDNTVDPASDPTDWVALASSSGIALSGRTSNTILGIADSGKLIDITSGTFTQTFDAVATLGADWFVYLRNSGTGDITLDPNASEEIDGLTSFIMYPGESRLIQCDGTKLTSVVLTPFKKTFTSSGTFTKPTGYQKFGYALIAGGGGGSSGSRGNAATQRPGGVGGGGGANNLGFIDASIVGATETVTLGAGGAGGAAVTSDSTNGNAGSVGGNSTFGDLLSSFGGSGGGAAVIGNTGTSSSGGGVMGAPSGTTGGAPVTGAGVANSGAGGAGGANGADGLASFYGGAGGGPSIPNQISKNGGSSFFGGAGGGGGGGVEASTNDPKAPGVGGSFIGTSGGGAAAGISGASPTAGAAGVGREGGGGGGSSASAAAAAGGDGGVGSGGGGGGASLNGNNSGAGGAGGNGQLDIWGI